MTHSKQLPVAGIAQRRRVLMKLLGDAAEPPSDASGYTQAMQRWLMIRPCRISVRLVLSRGKYRKQQAKEPAKWMHVAQTLELLYKHKAFERICNCSQGSHSQLDHHSSPETIAFQALDWMPQPTTGKKRKEKKNASVYIAVNMQSTLPCIHRACNCLD